MPAASRRGHPSTHLSRLRAPRHASADPVFTGEGLIEAAATMSWAEIREMANER